jgi:hypothetical protein
MNFVSIDLHNQTMAVCVVNEAGVADVGYHRSGLANACRPAPEHGLKTTLGTPIRMLSTVVMSGLYNGFGVVASHASRLDREVGFQAKENARGSWSRRREA